MLMVMSALPAAISAKVPVAARLVSSTVEVATLSDWLEQGSEALRVRAEKTLHDPTVAIDREAMRNRLLALLKKYKPAAQPRESDADGLRKMSVRAWILYILPVVGSDPESTRILQESLDKAKEPNKWCRYWSLAGQHRVGLADPLAATSAVLRTETEDLVKMLAHAIRAASNDDVSLAALRSGIATGAHEDLRWATLRALRVAPSDDGAIIEALSAIIDEGANSDVTYDAVQAAGRIDDKSEYARHLARALGNFVDRWKTYRGRDAMRIMALKGLRRLADAREAQVVLEQLLDDNLAVVCEAARTLESILNVAEAVDRVVDRAALVAESDVGRYAEALRWMSDRQGVVEQLSTMMAAGTSPPQRDVARKLLSEIGGAAAFEKLRVQSSLMTHHAAFLRDSEERVQQLFEASINDAKHGFQQTLRMDQTLFYGGFTLVGLSATLMLYHQGTINADWVGSGTTGVLGVLYTLFFAKPREQVQRAVDHLMHLKVVFLGYLRQLHQADSAYIRRLLDDRSIASAELKEFNALIDDATTKAGQQFKQKT
jgi:hypothetical protein